MDARFSPIARAMGFATMAHYGQLDKAGKPYIDHPIAIFNVLKNSGASLSFQIAALLHDVVEDTPAEIGDIYGEFGFQIAAAVDHLTRQYIYALPDSPLTVLFAKKRTDCGLYVFQKKEPYREFVMRCKRNPIARAVKIEDIRHNLSRMEHLPREKQEYLRNKYDGAIEFLMDDNSTSY